MKRTTVIIAAILATTALVACRGLETVIVNPEFDASDVAYYMFLTKIERADTATVVYADVYNLPDYGIYLSSGGKLRDSKGKTYKLLACEGFQLDESVLMPASGTMSPVLYFEPVDKGEKVVDYIDMVKNHETITGIKLYKVKHTEPVRCVLKGELIDRPLTCQLLLVKTNRNFQTTKEVYIPVRNGRFEYTLHADVEEAYMLVFRALYIFDFIAETGTLEFTFNPDDRKEENVVKGGKHTGIYRAALDTLNKEERLLSRARQQLMDENRYFNPEISALIEQLKALDKDDTTKRNAIGNRIFQMGEEENTLTEDAKALHKESDRIYKEVYVKNLLEYVKTHVDIAGYALLVKIAREIIKPGRFDLTANTAPMLAIFHDAYEKKFPHHPYTSLMQSYEQAAAIQPDKPSFTGAA
jgi:hypothetical protein